MITSPQMAAIVRVLARAVVISSINFQSHGWKHVVATRAHVVADLLTVITGELTSSLELGG